MNRVYFVRHGENPANLNKQLSHRLIDYSLTPKGVLQAQQTAAFFVDKGIDAIYTSPLKRARETAEIIGAAVGLPAVEIEEFREINVGDLEVQQPLQEHWDTYFRIARDWVERRPDSAFPGGENHHQLVARVRRGLAQALAGRDGQNVVVVAHGGLFFSSIGDLAPEADLAAIFRAGNQNCSVSELLFEQGERGLRATLVAWASCGHLSGEAAEFVLPMPDSHARTARGEA